MLLCNMLKQLVNVLSKNTRCKTFLLTQNMIYGVVQAQCHCAFMGFNFMVDIVATFHMTCNVMWLENIL